MITQKVSADGQNELSRSSMIVTEPADPEDLTEMVELHIQANPDSYLTGLGRPVLSSIYKYYICNPRGIALLAKDSATRSIAGVAVGCDHPRRFFRRLAMASLPAYLWTVLSQLLHRDLPNVGATKRYQHQVNLFPTQDIVYFSQLHVSPSFQRRRVGSTLALAMYDEVKRRGYRTVYLITDQDNASVRALHEKMGCGLVKEFTTPSGVDRCLYIKEL